MLTGRGVQAELEAWKAYFLLGEGSGDDGATEQSQIRRVLYMIFDCASCSSCYQILRDDGARVEKSKKLSRSPFRLLLYVPVSR